MTRWITLAVVALIVFATPVCAQTEIPTPATSGDQLLFVYDARASRVPFLVVSNFAATDLTVEIAWYAQTLDRRLATEYRTLTPLGNTVIDPSGLDGVNGNAGITVVTPVRSADDPTPVVPPSNLDGTSGPLFGGFTLANLDTGAGFGQNPLARLAVNSAGARPPEGTVVDGTFVQYQRIVPDLMSLPFYFNPSDPQLTNQVILGSFADQYGEGGFAIAPAEVQLPFEVRDAEGTRLLQDEGPVVRGVYLDTVQNLASTVELTSSGKFVFSRLGGGDARANVFGLMTQALGTFSVGQRMPGAFGAGRWLENGDGTATDVSTGLVWELKSGLDGTADPTNLHDADNRYGWCADANRNAECDDPSNPPDGSAFVEFLAALNGGTSADGTTTTGCFAAACDWRIPTVEELVTLWDDGQPCFEIGGDPEAPACTSIPGETPALNYWTSTEIGNAPHRAVDVVFDTRNPPYFGSTKTEQLPTRAVRSGAPTMSPNLWIPTPDTSGDQLLFVYDATESRVPFLVVSNLAAESVLVEVAWYAQALDRQIATQFRSLPAGGNAIFDPSGVEGVSGNAGMVVVTPVRSEDDPSPVIPPTLSGTNTGPLFGGFTLADTATGAGFGQNPLARRAIDGVTRERPPAGTLVDGDVVFYQRIEPANLALPFYFNPSDPQLTNRVILGVFRDVYGPNGFQIGSAQADLLHALFDANGGFASGVRQGLTGVRFDTIQDLAASATQESPLDLETSGKVTFTNVNPFGQNVFGLMTQALGTFSVGQRMPGTFGRGTAEPSMPYPVERWTDNGDGTATDNATGLTWELKSSEDDTPDPENPHDADNIYSWCNPGGLDRCDAASNPPDGSVFVEFLNALNGGTLRAQNGTEEGCFAEHCDWRIPTIEELASLVEPELCDGSDCTSIPGVQVPSRYWSSSTFEDGDDSAWHVNFEDGTRNGLLGRKFFLGRVRAVRGPN